jgi:hypothetical protein
MEECTYFWGVNTSWGINMAESKRPINQEDNQAPQPTFIGDADKNEINPMEWLRLVKEYNMSPRK